MYIVIFVSQSIKLFKFVIKMSWWINTKKCWKKQRTCVAVEGSVVWFIAFRHFFFCTVWGWKNRLTKEDVSPLKKKYMVVERFRSSNYPHFFSPSFSRPPTFSHTKSVIIAQETRITVTMLSLFLQKHDNYRKWSSIFFVILWHHERQGGGGCLGGSGGTKTCHPLCLTGPENSWFWGRFIIYIYIFFFLRLCVFEWGHQQQWTPALSGRVR